MRAARWLIALVSAVGMLIAAPPAIAAETGPAATSHALTGQYPVQVHQRAVSEGHGPKAAPSAIHRFSTWTICLTNANAYCLVSNGAGNQVTISNNPSNWATFTIAGKSVVAGFVSYQFENAHQNCLRAGTGSVVKIENGQCDSADNADWWVYNYGFGPNRFASEQYNDVMKTDNNANGENVWHGLAFGGDWRQWTLFGVS